MLTGFGLISPIFAIYINNHIDGGSIFMAGMASTIFWIVRSMVQLPLSVLVDNVPNRTGLLLTGVFLKVLVPF